MTIYYSPATRGFYDTSVMNYPTLPEDIIEVTSDQRDEYLYYLNEKGKKLIVEDGNLRLVDDHVDETWGSIRLTRNLLLDESDHTQTPDYPGDKEAWKIYRQALRDIPQKFTDPSEVVWPEKPKK